MAIPSSMSCYPRPDRSGHPSSELSKRDSLVRRRELANHSVISAGIPKNWTSGLGRSGRWSRPGGSVGRWSRSEGPTAGPGVRPPKAPPGIGLAAARWPDGLVTGPDPTTLTPPRLVGRSRAGPAIRPVERSSRAGGRSVPAADLRRERLRPGRRRSNWADLRRCWAADRTGRAATVLQRERAGSSNLGASPFVARCVPVRCPSRVGRPMRRTGPGRSRPRPISPCRPADRARAGPARATSRGGDGRLGPGAGPGPEKLETKSDPPPARPPAGALETRSDPRPARPAGPTPGRRRAVRRPAETPSGLGRVELGSGRSP
jgi:hypothetical protein